MESTLEITYYGVHCIAVSRNLENISTSVAFKWSKNRVRKDFNQSLCRRILITEKDKMNAP